MPLEAEPHVTVASNSSPARLRQAGATHIFQKRVASIDRLATSFISFSGVAIITTVLGIGLFLFLEVWPLFQPARILPAQTLAVLGEGASRAYLVVADEYQQKALIVTDASEARLADLQNGGVESVSGRP